MFRQALGVFRKRGYSRDGLKKAKPCPVLLSHGDQSNHAPHSKTGDQLSYTFGGFSAVVLKPQTTVSPHMVHDKKKF